MVAILNQQQCPRPRNMSKCKDRETETDRETNGWLSSTDRQIDGQIDKQKDRQTKLMSRQTDRTTSHRVTDKQKLCIVAKC